MWLHKPMSDRSCHWCYRCVAFLLEWMDTEDKQGYHRQSHPELFLFARPNVVCRFSEMIRRWNRGYSHSTEIGTGDGFSPRGKGLICYSSAVSVFNLCPGEKKHPLQIYFFLFNTKFSAVKRERRQSSLGILFSSVPPVYFHYLDFI